MFPIRDDNPQLATPVVTYGLIVSNALAWFLLQGAGVGNELNVSVCQYGLIPADLFPQQANDRMCPQELSSGWLGVFSSMFMHGSWMHILGNMWFLWIFGGNVEDSMGPIRFLIFYLLSGLAAAGAQVAVEPGSGVPMVGASGAIGGVMGAYIVLYPKVKVHLLLILIIIITTIRVPAVLMLGYWFALQFLGGFSSLGSEGGGVAFWAHIGGFVAGALLVFLFKDNDLLRRHPHYGW
ncbi:MAG: rhomboid family intramembrane serine protease [Pseudomonadota bacterium]